MITLGGGGIVGKVKQAKGKLAIKGPRLLASRLSQPKTSPIWIETRFQSLLRRQRYNNHRQPAHVDSFSVNLIKLPVQPLQ